MMKQMATAHKLQLSPEQIQVIARALGEPRRFAIFQQIAREPNLPCTALHVQEELSPATISHHLKELQEAGLIHAEREGRGMRLTLQRDVWQAYLRELSSL